MGWDARAGALDGRLTNVHSQDDWILKWLYRVAEPRKQKPIGLKRIKGDCPNITNVSADGLLGSGPKTHFRYRKNLIDLLGRNFW